MRFSGCNTLEFSESAQGWDSSGERVEPRGDMIKVYTAMKVVIN